PFPRNEASGALTGLTRVRKFHQDDAHIFCTPSQISTEIHSTLRFIDSVYSTLGFPSYDLVLSTRPTSFIGSPLTWDEAESALRTALDATGRSWTTDAGGGAFYGPKIDVLVKDAMGRTHQTATVQLDFQLPQRFNLEYVDADAQRKTPVIIHRAALGSVERIMAVLIEHWAGRWPFWISPRQAVVCPVDHQWAPYAERVWRELGGETATAVDAAADVGGGRPRTFYVDLDASDRSLPKRIRDAQEAQYNFMLIVGEREVADGTVSV
ncbi:hypothetical protein BDK51DRAFT_10225, partial [Blyttiomyces helicus]